MAFSASSSSATRTSATAGATSRRVLGRGDPDRVPVDGPLDAGRARAPAPSRSHVVGKAHSPDRGCLNERRELRASGRGVHDIAAARTPRMSQMGPNEPPVQLYGSQARHDCEAVTPHPSTTGSVVTGSALAASRSRECGHPAAILRPAAAPIKAAGTSGVAHRCPCSRRSPM